MAPLFCDKDYAIAIKKPFFSLRCGDIVVLHKEPYGKIIKEVTSLEEGRVFVSGTHCESIDSRFFGRLSIDSILAKVLFKIPRPKKHLK